MTSDQHAAPSLTCQRPEPDHLAIQLAGTWRLDARVPGAADQVRHALVGETIKRLTFDTTELEAWDSTLLAFVMNVATECAALHVRIDYSGLPQGAQGLLKLAAAVPERTGARRTPPQTSFVGRVGDMTLETGASLRDTVEFFGESLLAVVNMIKGKAIYRKHDVIEALQQCGVDALPIVALISVMVGMILAFLGSVQLKMFGAQIFVADLVGVGMVREMGALMTGIIMAGRTGASFAARLGSMQVNEEVDALTTMGFSPMEFLVLPRMIAMVVMMPLLCIYANLLGILGGAIVGVAMLDLTLTQYYLQTISAISLQAVASGLIKSMVFGVLVAISGCMYGIRCGRSASAVGDATTRAVVSGIVSIIIWDCVITVVYTIIGF